MAMYCGDEVCAVVADMGHATCRFGQAGQDTPRNVFRSDIGLYQSESKDNYVVGDSALRVLRSEMDVISYCPNDDINWDATETLLKYGLDTCLLHVDQKDYPLLLAENQFRLTTQKEKLLELIFEKFDLPATYSCHNATLSSFASGRPTSIVVDFGAAASRCIPVVDGFVLHRSSVATRRGGFYFDQVFAESLHMDFNSVSSTEETGKSRKRSRSSSSGESRVLTPWYECGGTVNVVGSDNQSVGMMESKRFSLSQSFRRMHCLDTLRDVRHWMCFVPRKRNHVAKGGKMSQVFVTDGDDGYDVSAIVSSIPPYELPDGTLIHSSNEVSLTIEEHLFNQSFATGSIRKKSKVAHTLLTNFKKETTTSKSPLRHGEYAMEYDDETDMAGLIMKSVMKADVDSRKELFANVLVVGGGALTDGIIPRLQSDLSKQLPSHIKVKVVPSILPIERQHAAWLGGSILGICGSFQQLWISREEYQEHGATIHRQRCVH